MKVAIYDFAFRLLITMKRKKARKTEWTFKNSTATNKKDT